MSTGAAKVAVRP